MTIARLIAIAVVLAATPARAQSVEAETLFREGKKLLKAGKIAEACDKLDASNRLESSVGTLLNLADCREKNHQLASAWATFDKAASAAKVAHDTKREVEAKRRAKKLEPRLLYLTVAVPDSSRIDGLAITRNGVAVDPELWNQSVPIDRGDYAFTADAPGHVQWKKRVSLEGEAQKATVAVPALDKAETAEPTPAPVQAHPPVVVATPLEVPPEDKALPSRWTGARKAAVTFAILGLGAAGAGIAFGLHGKSLEKQSDAICPTTLCNDDHAISLNSDARRAALYADIGYAAGGTLVGAAIVLWLVGAPVTPVVASDQVGIAFEGHF
jgi:hypothetical protein